MADIKAGKSPVTIDGVNDYILGGHASGDVSVLSVHITSNTATGSITVKGRARGTTNTMVAIPYKSRYLNGAVAADLAVTTAITGTSIIEINAAGLDIGIDTTALSANTFTLHYEWLVG